MCPLPDDRSSRLTCLSGNSQPDEFSPEERRLLLRLAHDAIAAAFDRARTIPGFAFRCTWLNLAAPSLLFIIAAALRGCVGYVLPVTPLYRTVAESARGAAFDDSRFSPVTPDEAPELQVSLSVLSPPQPIPAGPD